MSFQNHLQPHALGAGHIVVEIRALSLSTPPLCALLHFAHFLTRKIGVYKNKSMLPLQTVSALFKRKKCKFSHFSFWREKKQSFVLCPLLQCCSIYWFLLLLIIWRGCHVKHCELAMWKIWHKTNSCSLSSPEHQGQQKTSLRLRKRRQNLYFQIFKRGQKDYFQCLQKAFLILLKHQQRLILIAFKYPLDTLCEWGVPIFYQN